ncbi:MAG TPA: acyltransferase [Phycisphaerales bacterium]|nr:acyltransferase [Phycisphaerales bacterium]
MGAIKDSVVDGGGSSLQRYQDAIIGSRSKLFLLRYELTQLLTRGCPGALGLLLRQKLVAPLLGDCGRGLAMGSGVVLRHPKRIVLGDGVVLDDNCCLDANSDQEVGIRIGSRSMFGHTTRVCSKLGTVSIGSNCGFGAGITVHSSVGGSVTIGDNCLVAGNCYLGGGQYHTERTDIPIVEQGHISGQHLTIGDNCWIGAGAVVINGVRLGRDVIVAAGAVVTRDVPDFAIVGGVPAKVLRVREPERAEATHAAV